MAQAFAKHTKGNAHIIIIGRNKEAAESIISTFPKPTSTEAKHEFVQADATLMANVHSTTSELLSRLPKINYLIMSPGVMTMAGRNETSEGIDKKLALHYYCRFAFTYDLLPLLKKAEELGEDAKAFSVFAAGHGGTINLADLGLKKTFSLKNAGLQGVSYMDAAYKVCRVVLDTELKLTSCPLRNSPTKTPPPSLPSLTPTPAPSTPIL